MFPVNTLVTNGSIDAVVTYSDASLTVVRPAEGGESMALASADARNWRVKPSTPVADIKHPHCVYRADGTRLDGYADLNRAHARARKFLGKKGYFIVTLTPEMMEWVPASR